MGLPKTSIQLSCFFFIAAVQAYTRFDPICSTPTNKVNYVAAPSSRGTLDILMKSIFTIFACTWTIHHPNVPRQYHGYLCQKPKSKLRQHLDLLNWRLKGLFKSTGRMMLTIFAPEVIIAVAYNDLCAARADHKLLDQLAEDDSKEGDPVDWSLDHTYYANMGGFVITKRDAGAESENGYNLHHLSGRDLYILRKKKCIGKLPNITKRELKDRVKSDSLIKAISMTQIIWSTARILDRAVYGLPICALELTVLAFALCAVAIYWLYWDKPKSIGASTTIKRLISYERIREILAKARGVKGIDVSIPEMEDNGSAMTKGDASTSTRPESSKNSREKQNSDDNSGVKPEIIKAYSTKHIFSLKKSESHPPKPEAMEGAPMRIDTIREGKDFGNGAFWALLAGVVLFGGIHVGGWHFEFPSDTDRMLWRVATIYSVGCVFIALVVVLLRHIAKENSNRFFLGTLPKYCGKFLHVAGLSLYVVARLVILFEMFWTLLFLPVDTYASSRTFY